MRMQLITGRVSSHCWDGDNSIKAEKTFFSGPMHSAVTVLKQETTWMRIEA